MSPPPARSTPQSSVRRAWSTKPASPASRSGGAQACCDSGGGRALPLCRAARARPARPQLGRDGRDGRLGKIASWARWPGTVETNTVKTQDSARNCDQAAIHPGIPSSWPAAGLPCTDPAHMPAALGAGPVGRHDSPSGPLAAGCASKHLRSALLEPRGRRGSARELVVCDRVLNQETWPVWAPKLSPRRTKVGTAPTNH